MGEPTMHALQCTATVFNLFSDSLVERIGLRSVSSELTSSGARLFRINTLPILLRGAGYSPEIFLRHDTPSTPFSYATHLDYTRHMMLNVVRLEGKFEDDAFYELADERGLLVMHGLCCCDSWQHWPFWTTTTRAIAAASVSDQAQRLRWRASSLVFLYSSDELPVSNNNKNNEHKKKQLIVH